ncbi:MAG TPA: 16S rRNA (guanine(966)-N(2))-methyltransferase RsmD [Candidatus Acidoferrales bacterium]|jgi:16S rRNA (guanine(966)-N(2))-methyltransferase RsmD|nr:16S rRNA (guanine(966)-N(2))-methyltransferase RsmD [Candidatus Acidoferrales bacterium]
MRIIAGEYGSRRLKGPGTLRLRPTSDRLRETLFDILGADIEDSLFVDAFAGTGAVGIEALSRGARQAFFLENHPRAVKLIRQNLEQLAIGGGAEILEGDALRGLERIAARHLLADFIFLDPPYTEAAEHSRVLDYLDVSRLLPSLGQVIVEHHRKVELPARLEKLERMRIVEQGDATLSFYRLARAA